MSRRDSVQQAKYFANMTPGKLASELEGRVKDFDEHLTKTGRIDIWRRSYTYYNQGMFSGARITSAGPQGEYARMHANHFRNLLTHQLNITTGQRPKFDARATNTDHKSMAQCIVANAIVEYYNRYKGMESVGKVAAEDSLVYGDAYVYQGWDYSLGRPIMANLAEGKEEKEGDVLHKNFTPQDVIFDHKSGAANAEKQWYCLRDFQNKWDLIATYPEMRSKILRYGADVDAWAQARVGSIIDKDSDLVPVYIFIHKRTAAVPNGRFLTFLGKDCWLVDSDLPAFYKQIPIKRLCATEQRGTGFGYTVAYDLAPLCEAVNALASTIITNQKTFGVQNILVPAGSGMTVEKILDGLNMLTYTPTGNAKPEGINLTNTPAEIFNFLSKLETMLEVISGINSVARGQPEASLKSGSALALVQSMAVQFMSGFQAAYTIFLEELATGLIDILKSEAKSPRLIEIAGKNNRSYMKEFKAEEISNVSRVTVDMGNPMARTTAGKVAIADNLMKQGMIETPEQYFQVLTTGNLEPLFEGKQAEIMNIRAENEALSSGSAVVIPATANYAEVVAQNPALQKGIPVIALLTDNHPIHVREHKAVLADPEMRKNPAVVSAVLNHIQQHMELYTSASPVLIQMLKEEFPVISQAQPAKGKDNSEGPDGEGAAEVNDARAPAVKSAAAVRQPNLPRIPVARAANNGGS